MKNFIACACAGIALLLAACALRGGESSPVPESTKWVVQIQWQRMLESNAGPVLMALAARPEYAGKLTEVSAHFGVNVLSDIQSLKFFGKDANEDSAVCAVSGRFDSAKLNALAQAADQHKEQAYASRVIHQWQDRNRKRLSLGCLIDEHLLLLGNTDAALKLCIDTLDGKAPPSTIGAALESPATLCFYMIQDLQGLKGVAPKAAILHQAKDVCLRLEADQSQFTVTLEAKAMSEAAAKNIKSIAEGLRALAVLNAEEDPHSAALAEKIQIQTDGVLARLSLNVQAETVTAWLQDRIKESATGTTTAPNVPAALRREKN